MRRERSYDKSAYPRFGTSSHDSRITCRSLHQCASSARPRDGSALRAGLRRCLTFRALAVLRRGTNSRPSARRLTQALQSRDAPALSTTSRAPAKSRSMFFTKRRSTGFEQAFEIGRRFDVEFRLQQRFVRSELQDRGAAVVRRDVRPDRDLPRAFVERIELRERSRDSKRANVVAFAQRARGDERAELVRRGFERPFDGFEPLPGSERRRPSAHEALQG